MLWGLLSIGRKEFESRGTQCSLLEGQQGWTLCAKTWSLLFAELRPPRPAHPPACRVTEGSLALVEQKP